MSAAPALVPSASDRALAIDAAPLIAVSLAIVVAADRPAVMGAVVAVALLTRFALLARLPRSERGGPFVELAFFAGCLTLGAVNDFRTVVAHGVYEYVVPSELPALSTVPIWMLVYWGLILRFVATLCWWRRLPGDARPSDDVRLFGRVRSAPLRVAVMLVLIVATRSATYARASDPLWSWLPYALALAAAALMLAPRRRDLVLMAMALAIGPAVEVAYIQLGGLHRYALGWFFGVPLWIVLWWVLAVWLFSDLATRARMRLGRWAADRRSPSAIAP